MKYKYGFKDQKIQNFFCSLFDKEKIFLMVDFTKRNFPEATYITIDPVRSGRSNYNPVAYVLHDIVAFRKLPEPYK